MSFSICFELPSDLASEDRWAHLVQHWRPDRVFVWSWLHRGPRTKALAGCERVSSIVDVPSPVIFAPSNGRHVRGDVSLLDFEHPPSATYVFGSEDSHDDVKFLGRSPAPRVYIPTDSDSHMHAVTAAAVALWDRRAHA